MKPWKSKDMVVCVLLEAASCHQHLAIGAPGPVMSQMLQWKRPVNRFTLSSPQGPLVLLFEANKVIWLQISSGVEVADISFVQQLRRKQDSGSPEMPRAAVTTPLTIGAQKWTGLVFPMSKVKGSGRKITGSKLKCIWEPGRCTKKQNIRVAASIWANTKQTQLRALGLQSHLQSKAQRQAVSHPSRQGIRAMEGQCPCRHCPNSAGPGTLQLLRIVFAWENKDAKGNRSQLRTLHFLFSCILPLSCPRVSKTHKYFPSCHLDPMSHQLHTLSGVMTLHINFNSRVLWHLLINPSVVLASLACKRPLVVKEGNCRAKYLLNPNNSIHINSIHK